MKCITLVFIFILSFEAHSFFYIAGTKDNIKSYSKQETLNSVESGNMLFTIGRRPNKYYSTELSYSSFELDEGASRTVPEIVGSKIKAKHIRLGGRVFISNFTMSFGYDYKNAERILSVNGISSADPSVLYYKENLHGLYLSAGVNINLLRYFDVFAELAFTSNEDFNTWGTQFGLRIYPFAWN